LSKRLYAVASRLRWDRGTRNAMCHQDRTGPPICERGRNSGGSTPRGKALKFADLISLLAREGGRLDVETLPGRVA
jgi:hypothetical protein